MNARNILINTMKWMSISLIFAVCLLFCGPSLHAQDVYQHPETAQQQNADCGDKELKKFSLIKNEVDEIRKKYSQSLGMVDDPDKARSLQDKYIKQVLETIREKGMNVERYTEISRALQRDPELREKIEKMTEQQFK